MPIYWTPRFRRDWKKLPSELRQRAGRAARQLEADRSHPSLRLKKLQRLPGYYELRVDEDYRIILTIEGDTFTFITIGRHDVLDRYGG